MKTPPPKPYAEPGHVRRKLARALRALAGGRRFTKAERDALARMAGAWEATLPADPPEKRSQHLC